MKLLIHSKRQSLHYCRLETDKLFHLTFCNGCNCLSMLCLRLIDVSKTGPVSQLMTQPSPAPRDAGNKRSWTGFTNMD